MSTGKINAKHNIGLNQIKGRFEFTDIRLTVYPLKRIFELSSFILYVTIIDCMQIVPKLTFLNQSFCLKFTLQILTFFFN